jgi:hypothetical protein
LDLNWSYNCLNFGSTSLFQAFIKGYDSDGAKARVLAARAGRLHLSGPH